MNHNRSTALERSVKITGGLKPMGYFYTSRDANSVVSDPIWSKFEFIRDFMHVLVTCKYKKNRIKNNRERGRDTIFPIISQSGLSVAMDTRVLIQSAPESYTAFRLAQWCYT